MNLSEHLLESPAVQILEKSLAANRLAHGIMLQGESISMCTEVCHTLAARMLSTDVDKLHNHPDFFTLRPQGKARFINVGSKNDRVGGEWPPNSMRRLINDLQLTPQAGQNKVAVVYEVDRMNNTAANAFLKTLEEPPKNTTIFLLTTRPYKLLPTIRSRCLNVRLPAAISRIQNEDWQQWLADYTEWLHELHHNKITKSSTAGLVLTVYGLIVRFNAILETLSDASWEQYAETLPENLESDQKTALEAGFRKSIRAQLFTEIENQTRNFALQGDSVSARQLTVSIRELERMVGLLEVNLNESTALESFLLKSMRIWAK